jgi:transposase
MLSWGGFDRVYLALGVTDLRRGIDGLAVIVQECFELDPFSSDLFVFCNKKRDLLKMLHWSHNGFWLYVRRLEKGVFQWPEKNTKNTITIGKRELSWLLDGLELEQKQAHKKVQAKAVI